MSSLISLGRRGDGREPDGLCWFGSRGAVEIIASETLRRVSHAVSDGLRIALEDVLDGAGWVFFDDRDVSDVRQFRIAMGVFRKETLEKGPEKVYFGYDYFMRDDGLLELIELIDERITQELAPRFVPDLDGRALRDWFERLLLESEEIDPILLDGRFMSVRRRHGTRRALVRAARDQSYPLIKTVWLSRLDARKPGAFSLFERFGPIPGMRRRLARS